MALIKSDLQGFYLLLAGAGLSPHDVEELVWEISRRSPQKIAYEYEKNLRQWGVVESEGNHQKRKQANTHDIKSDAQSKVIKLITNDSDLTIKESFEILNIILKETFPERNFSKPNPKSGLASWIKSLSKKLTESELLHVATKFRNQSANFNADQQDWVLKEKNVSSQTD